MNDRVASTNGYVAAFIGAIFGALFLGIVGAALGATFGERTATGFDEIGSAIGYGAYGAFLGGGVGAAAGCWVALRARRYHNAGATAVVLAGLLAGDYFLWQLVLVTMTDILAVAMPWAIAAAGPLAARRIAT